MVAEAAPLPKRDASLPRFASAALYGYAQPGGVPAAPAAPTETAWEIVAPRAGAWQMER